MRCGLCGLTYVGGAWSGYRGAPKQTVYDSNGKMQGLGIYGLQGQRCLGCLIEVRVVVAASERNRA